MTYLHITEMLFLLLGSGLASGILAGMFGVGGGIVLVPVFLLLLQWNGYQLDKEMHLAVATSLATIIVTSLRSLSAHNRRGAVDFKLIRRLIIPVAAGSLAGFLISSLMASHVMMIVFGILGISIGTFMAVAPAIAGGHRQLPEAISFNMTSATFGGLSSIMGIGGGSFFVPYLVFFGRTAHNAVATSSGMGVIIAIPTVAAALLAPTPTGAPPFTMGLVNIPAAAMVAVFSVISAPWGAWLAHRLNARDLKRLFGLLLVVTSLKMLITGALDL